MGTKRQANIRKRKKAKAEKEKRDLRNEILIATAIESKQIHKFLDKKTILTLQLKLSSLIEKYKSKYGEIKQ